MSASDGILGRVTLTMPGRMLRMLSLLQGRREWSGAELAERLGVTDRTVRRDADRLRELGYPVEGTTGTAGGYRLASGRDLPPLLLDDEEAVAVVVGLRTATGVAGIDESALRALAKLEQVLPARLRHRLAAVDAATVTGRPRRGKSVDTAVLTVLATACRDHEIVSFTHRGTPGRRVEPHRLVTSHDLWYLVAYDTARADWRTFRVDRIADPVPLRLRFTPREPPADAATVVRRAITDAPYRFAAVATVAAPAGVVEARMPGLVPGRITPVDDGTCTVRLGADDPARLLADLVALDADYALDAAPDVHQRLRTAARRLLAATVD